jgi:hypothetical protein
LSSVCKTHILLGNENKAFNGERLWDKAKEIKSRFVNDYLPYYPKKTPSGTTSDDELLEMCLKNFLIAKQKNRLVKAGKDPESADMTKVAKGKTPVDPGAE